MFNVKIDMLHNAGFTHSFEWVDKDGNPISLEGQVLRMQIKRKGTDAVALVELSTANGRILVSGNRFTINIPANSLVPTISTDRAGIESDNPYVFDLLRIVNAEQRPVIMRGTISVKQGVTS